MSNYFIINLLFIKITKYFFLINYILKNKISILNYEDKSPPDYSDFPHSYQDILGKGRSIFTGDLNNSNTSFNLKEIEVFKIFK